MEKVKIQDIKTGAIKEVKKILAGDFIGTGNFRLYEAKEEIKKIEKATSFIKNNN